MYYYILELRVYGDTDNTGCCQTLKKGEQGGNGCLANLRHVITDGILGLPCDSPGLRRKTSHILPSSVTEEVESPLYVMLDIDHDIIDRSELFRIV